MQRIPMTPRGYRLLEEDLRHHLETLRPEVIRAIEEARAHGDISENSEFDAAKERQGQIEGRIRELEHKLAMAEVIHPSRLPPSDRVVFGATVTLRDLESDEELVYQIVGTDETDVKKGMVSITSPIGRALVGHVIGEEVKVNTPRGTRELEILKVEYI